MSIFLQAAKSTPSASNVNIPVLHGANLLMLAVAFYPANVPAILAIDTLDINYQNNERCTALHLAIYNANSSSALLILGHPRIDLAVNPALDDGSYLWHCCVCDIVDVGLALLAMPEVDVNQCGTIGQTPLMAACLNSIELALILIEDHRVDLNQRHAFSGETALFVAPLRVTRLLVDDPRVDLWTRSNAGHLAIDCVDTPDVRAPLLHAMRRYVFWILVAPITLTRHDAPIGVLSPDLLRYIVTYLSW